MPRAGRTSPLTRLRPASRARPPCEDSTQRVTGYAHERTDDDCDGDTAAGAVVGTDAVLHPGSLAAGRTQVHGMAGLVHRGRALLYAPEKERAAPGVAPRSDAVGRPGVVRGRQALPGDAGGAAGHGDGLGRGPAVADAPPDWESGGGAVGQRRGKDKDRVPRPPVAPGDAHT